MNKFINQYLEHIQYQRGYSPETLKAYGQDLRQLEAFLLLEKLSFELIVDDVVVLLAEQHQVGLRAGSDQVAETERLSAAAVVCLKLAVQRRAPARAGLQRPAGNSGAAAQLCATTCQ